MGARLLGSTCSVLSAAPSALGLSLGIFLAPLASHAQQPSLPQRIGLLLVNTSRDST